MPITQDRLITLIEIANKAVGQLDAIRIQIKSFEDLKSPYTNQAWEIRFQELCETIRASTWLDREVTDALAEERAHFKFTAKHNRKMREVMQHRRLRERAQKEIREEEEVTLYEDPWPTSAPAQDQTASEGQVAAGNEGLDLTQQDQAVGAPLREQKPFDASTPDSGGLLPAQPLRLGTRKD